MNDRDWKEFLDVAVEAARMAGRILADWSQRFTALEKSPSDFVTEADLESQRAIFEYIRQRYPDHQFVGEEGTQRPATGSPYRWIVDPLDGTSNYVHGFPFYAVSIGLEHTGRLVVGVIFDPTREEMFTASFGGGAFLNGRPIQPTCTDELGRALVVASLPVKVDASHRAVQDFLRVLPRAQHLQRTGSAALNLAYVACGRIDAYWSRSLHCWDMAAGVLLVEEAGGRVTQCNGRPIDLSVPDLLASNGSAIHEQLRELLG
ncbi:MAG: inositol monophosphatase [Planctomycetes bacterium]|nr:inositol monophosphatase [Planctomycetota bacterium]